MFRAFREWWKRRKPASPPDHVPGRAHLVLADGSIVEAELDEAEAARVAYLARRAAAPPPPD